MVTALQMGLPGVAELFIILLILFVVGLPLLAVLAVVVYLFTRDGDETDDTPVSTAKDERIEELEQEVSDLRERVDAPTDGTTENPDGDDRS